MSRRTAASVVTSVVTALGGALVLATALSAAAPSASAAGPAVCPGSVFVWDGAAGDPAGQVGDGVSWDDPFNWDTDCVPGQRFDTPYDDDVTIPAGATVRLRAGRSADLLHLHNAGAVVVQPGGWLVLHGTSQSADLTVQGGLGGEGVLTVSRKLAWVSTARGAATQTTRRCELPEVDCSSPVPAQPGRTVVAPGATVSVSGRGVNLSDGRVLENHGKVTISNAGYVAADRGTALLNLRDAGGTGQLVLQNDGGVYQGLLTPGLPLALVVNTGRILKSGGTGTSIIDADYRATDPGSAFTGTVVVRTGTISIVGSTAGPGAVTATVKQGAGLATGSCTGSVSGGSSAGCTTPVATADNPQATDVELTRPGSTSTPVTIEEMTGEANPGGLGVPVRIETPAAVATAAEPLVFVLRVDGTLLGGQDPAVAAATRPVQRKPDGGTYATLPACASSPLGGATIACVDRAASGADGDDAVLVVRSLGNSRYRIG